MLRSYDLILQTRWPFLNNFVILNWSVMKLILKKKNREREETKKEKILKDEMKERKKNELKR